MNILMVDELPIYIQGMRVELAKIMPNCHILDANNSIDAINIIYASPVSLILLDGEMDCTDFIQFLSQQYPKIPVVVMLRKMDGKLFSYYIRQNVKGLITKGQSVEKISLVLKMVLAGHVCFPEQTVVALTETNDNSLCQLSQRQKEVLSLLANGGTNKQIGRQLNISAGTVKVHLESIFNRLQVHNRTQAARLWLKYMGHY